MRRQSHELLSSAYFYQAVLKSICPAGDRLQRDPKGIPIMLTSVILQVSTFPLPTPYLNCDSAIV